MSNASMTQVFLGLGSNLDPEINIPLGVERLRQRYSVLKQSPSYRSPAMGFKGPDFINLVLLIECEQSLPELIQELKKLEIEFGRTPDAVKFSSRYLDIDVLLYGDLSGEHGGIQLPRSDVRRCAYVLRPLLDIYPDARDPVSGDFLSSWWPALAQQPLQRIE